MTKKASQEFKPPQTPVKYLTVIILLLVGLGILAYFQEITLWYQIPTLVLVVGVFWIYNHHRFVLSEDALIVRAPLTKTKNIAYKRIYKTKRLPVPKSQQWLRQPKVGHLLEVYYDRFEMITVNPAEIDLFAEALQQKLQEQKPGEADQQ